MNAIPWIMIAGGTFLLVFIPLIVRTLRRNPMAILRDQWKDLDAGCAWSVGILIILLCALSGMFFIVEGISRL